MDIPLTTELLILLLSIILFLLLLLLYFRNGYRNRERKLLKRLAHQRDLQETLKNLREKQRIYSSDRYYNLLLENKFLKAQVAEYRGVVQNIGVRKRISR